jgi:Zn-dependent peptidase ImmA (M78 family)
MAKVLGIYDSAEQLIHIDSTVGKPKQVFLTLHETAHHDLPVHRKMFRFFQDCDQTLAPEISDQFEREANNFARFLLFKDDAFAKQAADHTFGVKTPIKLAKHFGASVYASAREYARTNHRACIVYVLEQIAFVEGVGARALVRRIEPSPSFVAQFGRPNCTEVTPDHFLAGFPPAR